LGSAFFVLYNEYNNPILLRNTLIYFLYIRSSSIIYILMKLTLSFLFIFNLVCCFNLLAQNFERSNIHYEEEKPIYYENQIIVKFNPSLLNLEVIPKCTAI
jgi:hypothetical protein